MFYDLNKSIFKERECEKKGLVYTGAPANIKPESLTCNYAAISAWISIQQTQTEVL